MQNVLAFKVDDEYLDNPEDAHVYYVEEEENPDLPMASVPRHQMIRILDDLKGGADKLYIVHQEEMYLPASTPTDHPSTLYFDYIYTEPIEPYTLIPLRPKPGVQRVLGRYSTIFLLVGARPPKTTKELEVLTSVLLVRMSGDLYREDAGYLHRAYIQGKLTPLEELSLYAP